MAKYKLTNTFTTSVCLNPNPMAGQPCLQEEAVVLPKDTVIEATPNTNGSVTFTYKGFIIIIPVYSVVLVDNSTIVTFPPNVIVPPVITPIVPTPVVITPIVTNPGLSLETKKWILIIISVLIIVAILSSELSVAAKILYIIIYGLIGAYIYKQVLYPNTTSTLVY